MTLTKRPKGTPLPDNHPFKGGLNTLDRSRKTYVCPDSALGRQLREDGVTFLDEKRPNTSSNLLLTEQDNSARNSPLCSILYADGAVELEGVIPILACSWHVHSRLKTEFGKEVGLAAVEMLKKQTLAGDLGDKIYNFLMGEIANKSKTVWRSITYNPYDEDNIDEQYPMEIMAYEGVYWAWAAETEDVGYFRSFEDAKSEVLGNWMYVKIIEGDER